MSYAIPEIKVAAYNWTELPHMTQAERTLWQGLGWCYECYRNGEDKTVCDNMAKQYIEMYERRLKHYDAATYTANGRGGRVMGDRELFPSSSQ